MKLKKSRKELLEERRRIDAAMEQIERAKSKARAQRAEYELYLTWKVKMQRKERQQREEEDQVIRERVDAKLREVLSQHREEKKKQLTQWAHFRDAKPEKKKPLALPRALDAEKVFQEKVQQEREARRATDYLAHRRDLVATAPSRLITSRLKQTNASETVRTHASVEPSPPSVARGDSARRSVAATSSESTPARKHVPVMSAAVERIMQQSHETGELSIAAVQSVMDIPRGQGSGETEAQAAAQLEHNKQREKVATRLERVTRMYDLARSRRLYALNRMAADPPADYQISNDIMRYIPAELLEEQQTLEKSPRGTQQGSAFFMTAVDESRRAGGSGGPAPPETDESNGGSPPRGELVASSGGNGPHKKKYDENAWMKLETIPRNIRVVTDRNLEEEKATVEWYHNYYEQYTHIKKRTEGLGSQYSWERREKHVLPPVATIRLDKQ